MTDPQLAVLGCQGLAFAGAQVGVHPPLDAVCMVWGASLACLPQWHPPHLPRAEGRSRACGADHLSHLGNFCPQDAVLSKDLHREWKQS